MSRNTARQGAVSITDKHGNRTVLAPAAYEVYLRELKYKARMRYLAQHDFHTDEALAHEHSFSTLYDGSKILVCACGAVQAQGELYE